MSTAPSLGFRIIVLAMLAGFLPVRSWAANAADVVLEEVTVTAQKREQPLSKVGISVTAFSGEQMKALGVSSTRDISEQTPGLVVSDFGGGTTTVFTIRGSGQLDFNDQQEAPVAVYLDGVYQSFLAGVGFNFYDLERVEVLRGSQGTLFGRNATGGLVQIISRKPTSRFEGYADLTVGSYGERQFEGAVNLPFGETLSGRLSYYHESNDGYIHNPTGRNGGDKGNDSGRLQLLYKPSDELSVLFAGRTAAEDNSGQLYAVRAGITDANGLIQAVAPFGPVSPAEYVTYCAGLAAFNGVPGPVGGTLPTSGDCYNGASNLRDPFTVSTNGPNFYHRHQYEGSVTVDYKIGSGSLTSITDYQKFKKRYGEDSDSTTLDIWEFQQDLDAQQWSQELRFDAETGWGRYLVGLYYLSIQNEGRVSLDAAPTLGLSFNNYFGLKTKTYAAFSQVEYRFTPTLTGIIGLRGTGDEKRFHINPTCGFGPLATSQLTFANCSIFVPMVQGTGLSERKRTESNWSGNVELDWAPRDGTLLYGKLVRGHKAGGFNGGIINFFDQSAASYGPELPITYEAGIKSAFFDRRARLNASVFRTDYKGFQTFTQMGANLVVFNVDARLLGSELEFVFTPLRGLDVMLGASFLDAKQKNVLGPGGTLDRPMPNAPHRTYNALVRYQLPVFGGQLALQGDMNYRGDHSLSAIDQPGLHAPSYSLYNASVTWTAPNEHWSLKFAGKNLGNKLYFPTVFDLTTITGQIEPAPAAPRWYYGTVSFRF